MERPACRLPGGAEWEMWESKGWQRNARVEGWAGSRAPYPHGRPGAGRSWGGHAVPGSSSAPVPALLAVLLHHQPPAAAPVVPHGPSGPPRHSSQDSCEYLVFPETEPVPPRRPGVVRSRSRSPGCPSWDWGTSSVSVLEIRLPKARK